MSIKLRLALLLGLLLGGFVAALLALGRLERTQTTEMLAQERQTRSQLLNHAIDFANRSLPQFVADLAQTGEFARLVARENSAEARQIIESNLTRAGLDSLWIVGDAGTIPWRIGVPGGGAGMEMPLAPAEFAALVAETPSPRFFAERGDELEEICIRRLDAATGWLVVARRWNEGHLRALAALTGSDVSIRGPQEVVPAPAPGPRIVLSRTLADWRGHPLRVLRFEHPVPEIAQAVLDNSRQTRFFFAFGLMVIIAMWLALRAWVLRPLAQIGESLSSDNPQVVTKLSAEKSELGNLAALVRSSFEQREALQREIRERTIAQAARERSEAELRANLEERSRLGRDLHDGVIQSLYAAGMGLIGIRALLRPEQAEAAARLEQSRAALNETIHDVRNFLVGLEPEVLKLQMFSQAVAALLEMMNGIRTFISRIDIDDELAGRLTLAQRVHALQITREAVSNALRHGEASRVDVALRPHAGRAEFEVTDDGRGFDPGLASSPGRGLVNFAQRAHELGAELTVHSELGGGTRVKLVFSRPNL